MQLQLPPFSRFEPALLLLLVLGVTAAWGWSFWLLATAPDGVRRLPVWLWAALLVIAPVITVPMFLLIGPSPISSRVRRAAAIAAMAAIIVTVVVVAIQQIGILDCRIAPGDPLTEVCEMEPRSTMLPVGSGVLAAIVVGTFVVRRRRPKRSPEPLTA